MIKAIIFDLDDTLIQTSKAKYKALQHAAKKFYDLDLTDDDIRSHWGKPFDQFIHDLFREVEETQKIIENYYSVRNNFPTPAYEDSKDSLILLRKKYVIGMVTAATRHMTLEDLRIAGLSELMFDHIQTSEDSSYHKPDPKVFEPIKTKFTEKNILTNELLYIGDSISDYEAAHGAGLSFVGIANRTTSSEKFDNVGSKWITNLAELEALMIG